MHTVKAKGILSAKGGFNLYRGCEHGCIYCDSRSLCYQMQHDFEDIEVKENAIELMEQTLRRRKKRCMLSTGAMSDPYMPLEKTLGYMQKVLVLIERYGFGINILTKSSLVLRDLELLKKIHKKTKCVVQMTLTTYDEKLCKILEPNVATTKERFEVLKILHDHHIPTIAWLCPFLPFINDTEENIMGLLNGCINAGVHGILCFGIGLTLREGNREYFYQQLDKHFPSLRQKYHQTYGNAYIINSPTDQSLMHLLKTECRKNNILFGTTEIFQYLNTFEDKYSPAQISFDEL